jgi:ribosomal protein S27E
MNQGVFSMSRCPDCGSRRIIAQNVGELVNAVSMLKLFQRIQVRCDGCGWIGFDSFEITEV